MDENQMKVIHWMSGQDTGMSSKALACEYLGVENNRPYTPADPSDLGRCLRLIALVPDVRAAVDRLGAKHAQWQKAAICWDAITVSMIDEVGIDWSKGRRAEKTMQLMRQAGL